MAIPFFYIQDFGPSKNTIMLNEDTSKHVIQVLRMKAGEKINLTDGKGNLATCAIAGDNKKKCLVEVLETRPDSYRDQKPQVRNITIAISLIKNTNRFEWFLEKATEIGIHKIIPMICERTEKQKFRIDRMQGICISAMLQSQQVWLPVLFEPVSFEKIISTTNRQQKFIAHCVEGDKQPLTEQLTNQLINQSTNKLILIGPEGDFTNEEVKMALQNGFVSVTLGDTRLRTETAGVVAATLLKHL